VKLWLFSIPAGLTLMYLVFRGKNAEGATLPVTPPGPLPPQPKPKPPTTNPPPVDDAIVPPPDSDLYADLNDDAIVPPPDSDLYADLNDDLPVSPTVPTGNSKPTSGLRRLKQSEVTPALTQFAIDTRRVHLAPSVSKPIGTVIPSGIFLASGEEVVAVIEEHYHEPGGPVKPWGKHKGVSLFARATVSV
jgi:hypothetical protein